MGGVPSPRLIELYLIKSGWICFWRVKLDFYQKVFQTTLQIKAKFVEMKLGPKLFKYFNLTCGVVQKISLNLSNNIGMLRLKELRCFN